MFSRILRVARDTFFVLIDPRQLRPLDRSFYCGGGNCKFKPELCFGLAEFLADTRIIGVCRARGGTFLFLLLFCYRYDIR